MELILSQKPGSITFSNFEELKDALTKKLVKYNGVIYTPDNIDTARQDKEDLKSLKKQLDSAKKGNKEGIYATLRRIFI